MRGAFRSLGVPQVRQRSRVGSFFWLEGIFPETVFDFLLATMTDTMQWSWGDASLASSANPFSTSSKKGAKDTVAELHEHKAKGRDRPVVLHVKDSS